MKDQKPTTVSTPVQEPRFFLQDELIYFLKKNAKLKVTVHKNVDYSDPEDLSFQIDSLFSICDKEICGSLDVFTLPKLDPTLKFKVKDNSDDIANLIAHLMNQQKRIESLEQALQQYDKP